MDDILPSGVGPNLLLGYLHRWYVNLGLRKVYRRMVSYTYEWVYCLILLSCIVVGHCFGQDFTILDM
jgi:hypothetical protein